MEKTEEIKLFTDKVVNVLVNHKKVIRLINCAVYVIFVIIFTMITIYANGGIQSTMHLLNDYPEQKYQQLETEMRNIVVEREGIYPEELSKDSIYYEISYKESSNSEGKYTITLTDDVTITGTIGKHFDKEDLKIEREYETESDYRKNRYVPAIVLIILIPLLALAVIILFLNLLLLIIFIIEILVKLCISHKKAKK